MILLYGSHFDTGELGRHRRPVCCILITICLKAIILIVSSVKRILTLASFIRTHLPDIRCQYLRAFRSSDFQLQMRLLLFWNHGAEFDLRGFQSTLITICLHFCLY